MDNLIQRMTCCLFIIVPVALAACTNPPVTSTPSPMAPTISSPSPPALVPPPVPALTPVMVQSTSTATPIPTPAQNDPLEITLRLLKTNNGCKLPCWWGIVPGQTLWSDADAFLRSWSDVYKRRTLPPWSVYDVRSPISKEYSGLGEIRLVIATQGGQVKEIEITEFDEQTYHLADFLKRYGPPKEILVSTYSSDYGMPQNRVPFTIALYYPDKGIMATYSADADVRGGAIRACLEASPTLFLWSPGDGVRTIDYITGWEKNQIPYLSIDTASGLDVAGFYEKFSSQQSAPCIQTATSLWPGQ